MSRRTRGNPLGASRWQRQEDRRADERAAQWSSQVQWVASGDVEAALGAVADRVRDTGEALRRMAASARGLQRNLPPTWDDMPADDDAAGWRALAEATREEMLRERDYVVRIRDTDREHRSVRWALERALDLDGRVCMNCGYQASAHAMNRARTDIDRGVMVDFVSMLPCAEQGLVWTPSLPGAISCLACHDATWAAISSRQGRFALCEAHTPVVVKVREVETGPRGIRVAED